MDLGDDRGPTVREPLDDVELPQRATPVERFLGDPGRQLLEVGDAGVRWEVGDVEVQIEVDVRVGPARPDAERIAHDDLVERLDVVEAGGDETAHAVDRERLRSGRRVEDEDTEYVPGHGRRLGQEETSVEPGDRVSHRSTVLLPADPTPPAMSRPAESILQRSRSWHRIDRSRPSPGTAGRNRQWPVTRCRCTCRRRVPGRCRSRWPGSAPTARSCSRSAACRSTTTPPRPTRGNTAAGGPPRVN